MTFVVLGALAAVCWLLIFGHLIGPFPDVMHEGDQ